MQGTGAQGRVLAGLIGAIATLALLLPAASSADSFVVGDFKYVTETAKIPAAGAVERRSREVTAKCGPSWDVTGGGANPRGMPGRTFLTTTGLGGDHEWFADVWHTDSERTKLVGYAACVRGVDVTSESSLESVPMGPTTPNHAAECPGGDHALGGGTRLIGEPTDWALNSARPIDTGSDMDTTPDNAWQVFAVWDGASPTSLIADVTCSDQLPEYRSKGLDIAVAESGTATVKCKGGTNVTGGGAFISGASDQAHIVASRPIDSNDGNEAPDDGWAARARNDAGGTKTVTVHAVCL